MLHRVEGIRRLLTDREFAIYEGRAGVSEEKRLKYVAIWNGEAKPKTPPKRVVAQSAKPRGCGCGKKRKASGNTITVNHGAGGLGDALLGACAVLGLSRDLPQKRLVYKVHKHAVPFIELFEVGAARVEIHDHDRNKDEPPDTGDRQMNVGYNSPEVRERCPVPRWERYATNVGASACALPELRERDRLLDLGREYAGAVILSPFASYIDREWSQRNWLALVDELKLNGYRVVIVSRDEARTEPFTCEKLIGAEADLLAGALLNALCVVGHDSGIAHLAGIMGVPTVVICGQTTGKDIFGFYKRVKVIQGKLPCDGCWWQSPYHSSTCSPFCPSMAQIPPAEVRHWVDQYNPAKIDLVTGDRYAVIRECVRATAGVAGVLAEMGCYRGGTARQICAAAPGETVHLFDTFAGLPCDDIYPDGHKKGDFACDLDQLKLNMGDRPVVYHEGVIPESLAGFEDMTFRFVHLDLDGYEATRAALEFVWPRLSPGGRVVLDDYADNTATRGVAVAVAEVLPGVTVRRDARQQGWIEKPRGDS